MNRRGLLRFLGLAPVAAPTALAAATTALSRDLALRGMTSAFIDLPPTDFSHLTFKPGVIEFGTAPSHRSLYSGGPFVTSDYLKRELVQAYRALEAESVVEPPAEEPSYLWLCDLEGDPATSVRPQVPAAA